MNLEYWRRLAALAAACVLVLLCAACSVAKDPQEDMSADSAASGDSEDGGSSHPTVNGSHSGNPSRPADSPDDGAEDKPLTDDEFSSYIEDIENGSSESLDVSIGKTDGTTGAVPSSSPQSGSTTATGSTAGTTTGKNPTSNPGNTSTTKPNLWDKDGDGYYDITVY